MYRLLIIAWLCFLVVKLANGLWDETGHNQPDEKELVRDDLSGVYFNKDEAVMVHKNGRIYYFQTTENRDKFLASNQMWHN